LISKYLLESSSKSLTATALEKDQKCNDKRLRIAVAKNVKTYNNLQKFTYFYCIQHFRLIIMIDSIMLGTSSSPC
jgi:hypothetical protein